MNPPPRTSLWRHRDFRLYWTGQASDVLGSSLSSVAIPLVAVITLHATTWQAAILAAVQKTPPLLFSLPAGAWCDRVRKHPLMVATSLVCAVVMGSIPLAAACDRLTLAQLWGAAFVVGSCHVVGMSASLSYIPQLLPTDRLLEANAKLAGANTLAGGPLLTREVDLPDAWWRDLKKALAYTSTTPTSRIAVRQGWVDKSFTRFLGIPPVQITATQTGHGDLVWANITGPPLVLLDWQGWVRMRLRRRHAHAYSLTCPATARRIRQEFHSTLNSPEGRVGELVAVGQLLQVVHRGGHPELATPLKLHAESLTGVPVPRA